MLTVDQISNKLGLSVEGDGDLQIESVATLLNAGTGELSFLSGKHYKKQLQATRASVVILKEEDFAACPVTAIIADDPYLAYARAAALLYPVAKPLSYRLIHNSAVVGDECSLSNNVSIGANAVIGDHVEIGKDVVIGPGCVIENYAQIGTSTIVKANVTIMHEVVVGKRCIIHPGVVIGADGFGFASDKGKWVKIPQVGTVLIGNDVEIGANTTIDRGAIDNTIIGDGVILDNLIQIAHNVTIGQHTAIASSTAIAGSVMIGAHCLIAGAVAIAGHIQIADHVTINGMSMVTNSINEKGSYAGIPLEDTRAWRRNTVRVKHLDGLFKRVSRLEKKQHNN